MTYSTCCGKEVVTGGDTTKFTRCIGCGNPCGTKDSPYTKKDLWVDMVAVAERLKVLEGKVRLIDERSGDKSVRVLFDHVTAARLIAEKMIN